MPSGTKNRQLQHAQACKHYLRASHRDNLTLVEEFINQFEGVEKDQTRWSHEFSDECRVDQEMLQRADIAFRSWQHALA